MVVLMGQLYEQFTYRAPYDWLINKKIQEWDLKKANISILRQLEIINEDDYQRYLHMPKLEREIEIGKLRKNKDIEVAYQKGLVLAKRIFFEKNAINEENVLYIDHDSITLVYDWSDSRVNNINGEISPYIEFRLKNTYTSFYKLIIADFLYYNTADQEHYRFKGMDEENVKVVHKDYFIDLLLSLAYSAQNDSILNTLEMIKNVYKSYCARQMNINYYREFNSNARFKILNTPFNVYYADTIENVYLDSIDISHNATLLRLFYKIYMSEYFRQN